VIAHACEYMTGGRVVVLGATGRNFGAGMSGGLAFVFDPAGTFPRRCNTGMVDLDPFVDEDEIALVHELIARHVVLTDSALGARVLEHWDVAVRQFVVVAPRDFKRVRDTEAARAARLAADNLVGA
jgi:glutamate synthase (NADPH) large chain